MTGCWDSAIVLPNMKQLGVFLVVLLAGAALGGKGRGGGGKAGKGGGGWFSRKGKKPSGQPNYPRQEYEGVPQNPSGWKPPDARPPAYNPGYNGPPPAYSKNAPQYPQSGGHAPPPPYSQYPAQGHYPQYPGYGTGNSPHFSGFPQYPQQYGGGFGQGGFGQGGFGHGGFGHGGYGQGGGFGSGVGSMFGGGGYGHGGGMFGKRRGFGGIIPIPIPIPIGGGMFGYGSYGGGYYRNRGNSEVRDRDQKPGEEVDSKERPRILAPPDYELNGVTELPGDMPVAQWDIVGKETAAEHLKKRDEDYSGEFTDD